MCGSMCDALIVQRGMRVCLCSADGYMTESSFVGELTPSTSLWLFFWAAIGNGDFVFDVVVRVFFDECEHLLIVVRSRTHGRGVPVQERFEPNGDGAVGVWQVRAVCSILLLSVVQLV